MAGPGVHLTGQSHFFLGDFLQLQNLEAGHLGPAFLLSSLFPTSPGNPNLAV